MAGRPSPIDRVIGQREVDGQLINVTVADRIVAAIRNGHYIESAAASAGVHKDTVYEWRKVAGRARIQGSLDTRTLTDHETRCIAFSDAVDEAEATYDLAAGEVLERVGRGGIPIVVTTVKTDAQGNVIESTTRTSASLPDARTIEWRLSKRFKDRYGDRIEVTGADGGPVTLSMEERAGALRSLVQQVKSKGKEPREPKRKKRATVGSRPAGKSDQGAGLDSPGDAPSLTPDNSVAAPAVAPPKRARAQRQSVAQRTKRARAKGTPAVDDDDDD